MRAALVLVIAALVAASAAAATRTVEVPLDRSGAVPGSVELAVTTVEGQGPRRGTLLALSGGPGQSGADSAEFSASAYAPFLRRGYDVVSLDQRGTGVSALNCPSLQRRAITDLTVPPRGTVEACAQTLGAARAFYSTADTVADLEAVRTALGVERWAIAGISYGTYVAERYARAHPDRVERLILDSVVPQANVDAFQRSSMRRAAVVLRGVCAGTRCRGITRDPVADLRRLVRRADAAPLRGRLDSPGLFDLFTSGSYSPELQAELPGLVRAALDGDARPIVRTAATVRRLFGRNPLRSLSQGLHVSTLCADITTPWGGPATPLAGRAGALTAAAAGQPAREFAPFSRATATGNGLVQSCLRWAPVSVTLPPEPGPLPAVPTLLLAGGWDLSTPVTEAQAEARNAPLGQLVVVPRAGHNVITAACVQTALTQFASTDRVNRAVCRRGGETIPRPRRVAAR